MGPWVSYLLFPIIRDCLPQKGCCVSLKVTINALLMAVSLCEERRLWYAILASVRGQMTMKGSRSSATIAFQTGSRDRKKAQWTPFTVSTQWLTSVCNSRFRGSCTHSPGLLQPNGMRVIEQIALMDMRTKHSYI